MAVQEEAEEAEDAAVEDTEVTAEDEAAGATEEIDQREMEKVGKADKTMDQSTVTDHEDAVEAVVAAAGATTKRYGCRSRNLDVWLKMVRFFH